LYGEALSFTVRLLQCGALFVLAVESLARSQQCVEIGRRSLSADDDMIDSRVAMSCQHGAPPPSAGKLPLRGRRQSQHNTLVSAAFAS